MLKKWKMLILSGILALSALGCTACKDSEPPAATDGKTLMNGFETFDRDVQLIRLFNEFGRVEQNSDKQYVRSGEKSLKLAPLGARLTTANPYVLLPTFSTRFEEVAFGDFSNVDTVSCWFYNAEEENVNVGIGFGKGVVSMNSTSRRDEIRKTNVEYFTLKNGWNYIEYVVEPAYLAMQGLDIESVYGIIFEFDYVTSHDLADSPTVYLDDVCLTYTDTPKSAEFTMNVATGTTEEGNKYWSISDFEDSKEAYYYQYFYTYPAPHSAFPVYKTVYAGDYGVMAKSGTRALLVQKKHGGGNYGWPGLFISDTVVKAVFAAIGDDILENPQNYAFKFDLYNASAYTGGWSVGYENTVLFSSIQVQAGQWGEYSCTFATIDGYKEESAEKSFTQSLGTIRFLWSRYNNDEDLSDRPFLLDNVRIEKIA